MRNNLILLFSFLCLNVFSSESNYNLLYLNNNYDSVINITNTLITNNSANTNDYYWNALCYSSKGYPIQGINTLEKSILKYPNNTRLEKLLAKYYFETGNYNSAKKIYAKYSDDINSQEMIARIYEVNNNYEKAIEIYTQLFLADVGNYRYMKHLADNNYKIGNTISANVYYSLMLEKNPSDQFAAYMLSKILLFYTIGGEKTAIELCEKMLENDSTNINFLKQLGLGYYKINKNEETIEALSKAESYGDSSFFTNKYIGISYFKYGHLPNSREYLKKAYNIDSTDIDVCMFLGKANNKANHKEEALEYLNVAEKNLIPDTNILISIYTEQAEAQRPWGKFGQPKFDMESAYKTIELYEKLYELKPNVGYLRIIASLYERMNKKKLALIYHKKTLAEYNKLNESEKKKKQNSIKRINDDITRLTEELFFEGEVQ